MTPTPKPGILDIALYVGGRSGAPGAAKVFKLSSNESALGPSPKAIAALSAAVHDMEIYPDGSSWRLRDAIAQANGLPAERIVVGGEGSGPLLTLLANAYLQPGDEAIFGEHSFLVYEIVTLANSGKPVIVPEKTTNTGIKLDVAAMLAAVTPRTRLVYIANPSNPTGTYLTRDEMRQLHAGLPGNVLDQLGFGHLNPLGRRFAHFRSRPPCPSDRCDPRRARRRKQGGRVFNRAGLAVSSRQTRVLTPSRSLWDAELRKPADLVAQLAAAGGKPVSFESQPSLRRSGFVSSAPTIAVGMITAPVRRASFT